MDDPEHAHVKAVLILYSLESFLFKRLNECSREQDSSVLKTLGPYAVALTYVINNIQQERNDKIVGRFFCYSGLSLSHEIIDKWKKKRILWLDGYRSSTLDKDIAL